MNRPLAVNAALVTIYLGSVLTPVIGLAPRQWLIPPMAVAAETQPTKEETVEYLLKFLRTRGDYTGGYSENFGYDFSTDTFIQYYTTYDKQGNITGKSQTYLPLKETHIKSTDLRPWMYRITTVEGMKAYGKSATEENHWLEFAFQFLLKNQDYTTNLNTVYRFEKAFLHLYALVKKESDPFFVMPEIERDVVDGSGQRIDSPQPVQTQEAPQPKSDDGYKLEVGNAVRYINPIGKLCDAVVVTPGGSQTQIEFTSHCSSIAAPTYEAGERIWSPNSHLTYREHKRHW